LRIGHGSTIIARLSGGLRGGGKRASSAITVIKSGIIAEKTELIRERSSQVDASKCDDGKTTVEDAGLLLTKLFTAAETNAGASFKYLLHNLTLEGLDQVLEDLKVQRSDARVYNISKTIMQGNFAKLYGIYEEIGGVVETTGLTLDFILNQAFLKDSGVWDWKAIENAVKYEKEGRDASNNIIM
jgi:hypothetical protein